ncbi:MAG: DUF1330 domain-containing protein [Acidimicrobiales bacterium]|jgi:uncharacterized protein (DUF1330 family)|nr:DUF1330 domain-containing protein [Acidimicrobiales bacterium]
MSVEHVTPTDDRLAVVLQRAGGDDRPVVMLNLNRYRDRAAYPEGTLSGDEADVSGREAYLRYGIVAAGAIAAVGGKILWATDAHEVVIGCDHDRYDEVVAVWYPSRTAFLALADVPGYMEAHVHRDAAVEQATLLACTADAEPVLSNPFGV